MTKKEYKKQLLELKLKRKAYKDKIRSRNGSLWQRCQLKICSTFEQRANRIRSKILNPITEESKKNKAEEVLSNFEALVDKMTAAAQSGNK